MPLDLIANNARDEDKTVLNNDGIDSSTIHETSVKLEYTSFHLESRAYSVCSSC